MAGDVRPERRLVTALFADLAGFSALAERLDPEELAGAVDPALAAMADVVAAHGGSVEKYVGDAVLALFGERAAHEDDADRALAAALDLHAALPPLAAAAGAPLTLHIGVATGVGVVRVVGSAAERQRAVLADAVVVAQRIMTEAPPGQTYVAASTVSLTTGRFRFADVGRLVLKGRTEPVRTHRLRGARDVLPPPRRPPIVGRTPERATLTDLVTALATRGEGGVLLISGEPGIGKSRLVAEAAVLARRAGLRWLSGGATSTGPARPFGALRAVVPTGGHDAALRLLAGAESRVAAADPRAVRDALQRGVREALAATPTVLALEDLHWADAATLDLVGVLARTAGRDPVLLVLTTRTQLDADLGDRVRRFELQPLAPGEVGDLAADRLGGEVEDGLAQALAARTAGNPLFAEELLRALRGAGALVRRGRAWTARATVPADGAGAPADLPATVSGVLAAELDALPAPVRPALAAAAVLGPVVDRRLLASVRATVTTTATAADLLLEAGVVRPAGPGAVAFRHPLLQEVAYGRLVGGDRRALHRRVADAVEAELPAGDERTALLAQHRLAAGQHEAAADLLTEVGLRARRLGANRDAARAFAAAIGAAEAAGRPATARAGLLERLAEVQELQGDYDDAHETWRRAAAAGSGVPAFAGQASTLRRAGRYADALAVLDSPAAKEPLGDPRPLLLERSWVLAVLGRRAEALLAAREGLAAGPPGLPPPADRLTGRLLLQVLHVETLEGDLDAARKTADAAVSALAAADDEAGLVRALRERGHLLLRGGDAEAALRSLEDGLAAARRLGIVEEVGGCLVNLGLVVSSGGDHAGALARYREAVEVFEAAGHLPGVAIAAGNGAWELAHLGELGDAQAWAERSRALADAAGNALVGADSTATLSLVAEQQGRHAAAVVLAEEAASRFHDAGAAAEAREQEDRAGVLRSAAKRASPG